MIATWFGGSSSMSNVFFRHTFPKTSMTHEKTGGWGHYFPFGKSYFQGLYMLVSGRVHRKGTTTSS